jgi:hypothetical protein
VWLTAWFVINGGFGHQTALDDSYLSDGFGSEAAAGNRDLSVCFGEFIADG